MRSRKRRGAARPPPPSPVGEQAQVTIVRTAQAEEDLIDIWCFIASDNPRAADRLLDDLDATSRALAVDPGMGMARDDIAAGVRHFPVGRYLILYRELRDGIEVVRYVHGMRRLQDLF